MSQPKQHVHSALILERARQDATGETTAGWWKWEIDHGTDNWTTVPLPQFHDSSAYRYSMTDKHPQYVPAKPVLLLIDMAKLPHRTRVKCGQKTYDVDRTRASASPTSLCTLQGFVWPFNALRIAEQREFIYWAGGRCPLPEGLRVEVVKRDDDVNVEGPKYSCFWIRGGIADLDIIAYRILGVAPGYTDNPDEATHDKFSG